MAASASGYQIYFTFYRRILLLNYPVICFILYNQIIMGFQEAFQHILNNIIRIIYKSLQFFSSSLSFKMNWTIFILSLYVFPSFLHLSAQDRSSDS